MLLVLVSMNLPPLSFFLSLVSLLPTKLFYIPSLISHSLLVITKFLSTRGGNMLWKLKSKLYNKITLGMSYPFLKVEKLYYLNGFTR